MIERYTKPIVTAAKKKNYKITPFPKRTRFFIATKKNKQWWFYQSMTSHTPYISGQILKNKFFTNLFLKQYDFPVLPMKICDTVADCKNFLKIHKKIVVKPITGVRGKGITVGITKQNQLGLAFSRAKKIRETVICEKFVNGIDHRILVIGYKKIFAAQRIPANIIGDGKHTISQLIDIKNKKRKTLKRFIEKDRMTERILTEQHLCYLDVPGADQQIFLRKTANLATGGDAIDITKKIKSKIKKLSINVAKSLKMPVVGIDFISEDINNKPSYITELNAIPGILIHYHPDVGQSYDVGAEIVKLFK